MSYEADCKVVGVEQKRYTSTGTVLVFDFDSTPAPKINFNSALPCFLNAISLMSGLGS